MAIDFRSDTVTLPTPPMLAFMHIAPLGDDVFGEDPSINELENYAAGLFGMESAIFCPSGTMTNQIAIKCHTQPGDEVICDQDSHIYQYEGGGIAFNSGCSVRLIAGNRGRISSAQVLQAINADDIHKPVSRLVCLENTSNRGGGSCYNIQEIEKISAVSKDNGLILHLDGARLFNAIVATGQTAEQFGKVFDSISICLSKGLGAPVGSLLLGKAAFIKKARRVRKVFGGGMRQAGMLAAAGHYALQNNVSRLNTDHEHARQIADALAKKSFIKEILPVETNIIIAEIDESRTPASFVAKMKENGVLLFAFSPTRIRIVTHLDITPSMVAETIQIIDHL
ncbi:MAG: threonine aldolase family protein [Chitinophagaceae bacterium]